MAFYDTPVDPTFLQKGTESGGTHYITVRAPVSDEEPNRTYCEVTIETSGNPGSVQTLESGDISEPFDGRSIRKGSLTAGTYVFRAKADYDDSSHKEGPNGLSVTVP